MLTALIVGGLAVALLASLRDGDSGGLLAGGAPAAGSRWTPRAWHSIRPTHDPREYVITFSGPDPNAGTECVESPTATVDQATVHAVRVTVKVFEPFADPTCPFVDQETLLTLDAPLGDRTIEELSTGWAYRLVGDHFELVPESTPCGRMDCSLPSPSPGPCDSEALHAAVGQQVDGGIRLTGQERCDGSFLIVDMDVGSGGCPPTDNGPSPCQNIKRAYFVARDGQWRLVTYGSDETCDDVAQSTHVRFPDTVCP